MDAKPSREKPKDEKKKKVPLRDDNKCQYCGTQAKGRMGLISHMRKHKNEPWRDEHGRTEEELNGLDA